MAGVLCIIKYGKPKDTQDQRMMIFRTPGRFFKSGHLFSVAGNACDAILRKKHIICHTNKRA